MEDEIYYTKWGSPRTRKKKQSYEKYIFHNKKTDKWFYSSPYPFNKRKTCNSKIDALCYKYIHRLHIAVWKRKFFLQQGREYGS